MKTLFLSPPSFDGFDGGAGARYQAKREIRSFWYPTWLAQPAALVPNSKLMDCPPHDIDVKTCLAEAKNYDHVIIHTSTPSLKNDCKVAEAIKAQKPGTTIGFVGAHAAVLPTETLKASPSIDWVGRKEFDFTCKEVAEGRPLRRSQRPLASQGRQNRPQPRARIDPRHGRAAVGDGCLQARPANREIFHRLSQGPLRFALHRARLPGAMHVLPLAADHRRAQISRPFGGKCGGGNGPREKTVPAGAGIFLR